MGMPWREGREVDQVEGLRYEGARFSYGEGSEPQGAEVSLKNTCKANLKRGGRGFAVWAKRSRGQRCRPDTFGCILNP